MKKYYTEKLEDSLRQFIEQQLYEGDDDTGMEGEPVVDLLPEYPELEEMLIKQHGALVNLYSSNEKKIEEIGKKVLYEILGVDEEGKEVGEDILEKLSYSQREELEKVFRMMVRDFFDREWNKEVPPRTQIIIYEPYCLTEWRVPWIAYKEE
jgi:hypothetical protein